MAEGEVKGFVSKVNKDHLVVKIGETKFAGLKKDESIKVKGVFKGIKKNENVFFKPEAKTGDMWAPVAGSVEK